MTVDTSFFHPGIFRQQNDQFSVQRQTNQARVPVGKTEQTQPIRKAKIDVKQSERKQVGNQENINVDETEQRQPGKQESLIPEIKNEQLINPAEIEMQEPLPPEKGDLIREVTKNQVTTTSDAAIIQTKPLKNVGYELLDFMFTDFSEFTHKLGKVIVAQKMDLTHFSAY